MLRIIWIVDSMACSQDGRYLIDKIIPDMIWNNIVKPNKNPMFHIEEIEDGVGSSSKKFENLSVNVLDFLFFL